MHNAAFRHRGLDMTYIARDVRPEELAAAVQELRSPLARGANLTLPHKQAVLPLLDEVEQEAARIGAVNTIVNQNGRLTGHNTDLSGFLSALRMLREDGPVGADCLVLGAGGAARAVVAGLVKDGAARVWVANRTIERATALSETASAWGITAVHALGLDDLNSVIRRLRHRGQCHVVGLASFCQGLASGCRYSPQRAGADRPGLRY